MDKSLVTIQLFLPTGDPSGIRIIEKTGSILRGIEIPRNLLGEFYQYPEANQVGIYYLFSEDEKRAYIGATSKLKERLSRHDNDKNKDFWDTAVIFVSLTDHWTQTHVGYLESLAIKQAKAADRYALENNTQGNDVYAPLPLKAECKELHQLSAVLLGSLGYPLFKPLFTKQQARHDEFFCTGRNAKGTGVLTNEGFVVFKGAVLSNETSDSFEQSGASKLRRELINSGIVRKENNQLTLMKDYLFRKPSAASAVLLGRSSNGWTDWKNKSGKTLDAVKRQDIKS